MRGIRAHATPRLSVFVGEGFKIVAMGLLLALLLFVFVFYEPGAPVVEQPENPISEVPVTVPVLDPQIMAQAQDETRPQRLVRETPPFRHLLEQSLNVVPAVARQLGMPALPVDVVQLRANPGAYRGRYLWYEGELLELSGPIPVHPVRGYDTYEGRMKTPEGETVMFAFSLPPDPSIRIGDWVRMEGFFFKLRDSNFPDVEQAPMLVGPQLLPDLLDWDPILELDPAILARVRDGVMTDLGYVEGPDSDLVLEESQDVPLWHIASYALAHKDDLTLSEWRQIPAFVEEDQWLAMMRGEVPKGTPMRVMGEVFNGRTIPAELNPIGVDFWTKVWVRVHDLGGRLIPVWVPDRADGLKVREHLECRTYLFKRLAYESLQGDRRYTPVFVAASLDRYVALKHPVVRQIGVVVAGVVLLLIGIFYLMARRDRMTREQHELAMVERRRRRRSRMTAALGQQG